MHKYTSILRRCAALVLAGTAAAACDVRPATQPSLVAGDGPVDSQSPADDWAVNAQLAAVRKATAGFHDLGAAQSAGYSIENEPCVASPAGGMGIHAPNLSLILDPVLDPSRPELLLYEPQRGGGHRLVGVEYFQAVILRNKAGEEAPRLDPTPWNPDEFEIVNPRPSLFGQPFHLTPPPVATVPWHWSLHVWIWAHNPSGMFEEWNPTVQCG